MAKANPAKLDPQAPEKSPEGPEIVYLSEEAKAVKFEVNPNAKRYVVRGDGQITEEF